MNKESTLLACDRPPDGTRQRVQHGLGLPSAVESDQQPLLASTVKNFLAGLGGLPKKIIAASKSTSSTCRSRLTMPRLFFLITLILIVISLLVMVLVNGQVDSTPVEPGPSVRASKGEVWPKPMQVRRSPWFYELRPATFQFVASGPACALLDAALSRYSRLLLREAASGRARRGRHRANKQAQQASAQARPTWWTWRADDLFAGHLNSMSVEIGQCEVWPHASMDESYELFVDDKTTVQGTTARLSARSVWGAIRGLETFLQLFTPNGDGFSLLINATRVTDAPRFPHRGLLLDTSRHFLPVADIKLELDAMAAVKMNVLHWHIVDDQSFPWQSSLFPELSEYGAFDPTKIYSPQDVRDIIEVARLRGIRVIVEFDTPGHTRSWGEGRPGLLAACHDSLGRPDGTFANIDPTKPQNLEFIQQLFGEVAATFPDAMLHLGGDEVPNYCWDSDPSVRAYMENRGMAGNYHRLQSDYLRWLSTEVHRLNRTPIVWQEAWQNGDFQPNDVVVHVWLGRAMDLLQKITQQGFRALLSESWYLDHLNVGWQTMYRIDPQGFSGHAEQLRLVQGGEACMWAEMADETNMHSRVWPRAAAVAERLWSPKTTTDIKSAAHRLEELVCRLRRRGIPASPANGPGYCPP